MTTANLHYNIFTLGICLLTLGFFLSLVVPKTPIYVQYVLAGIVLLVQVVRIIMTSLGTGVGFDADSMNEQTEDEIKIWKLNEKYRSTMLKSVRMKK